MSEKIDHTVILLGAAAAGAAIAYFASRSQKTTIVHSESDGNISVEESWSTRNSRSLRRRTSRRDGWGSESETRRRGFSLREVSQESTAEALEAAHRTPAEVLSDLQRGNTRYCMGQMEHHHQQDIFHRRRMLEKQQFPSVAILGCADSRAPVEIIFDQGVGDIFVVRVAGNVMDTATTASLQYAINHLKVKVVIVMGHEACGAVKASALPSTSIDGEPTELASLLKSIKGGIDEERLSHVRDDRAHDREAVVTNVVTQVDKLVSDANVRAKVRAGELVVSGAFYELTSGIVDFFNQVDATSCD